MKNITNKIIILLSLMVITFSCDNFDDINVDPNNPNSVEADLILGQIEFEMANRIYQTGYGGNMGTCWSQQLSKIQYNDEERFNPRQSSISDFWDLIYTRVISDAVAMERLAKNQDNNNLQGIAKVMQAYGFSVLTDLYGDIPFTEAMNGDTGIISPKYDSQKVVYDGIFMLLDEANTLLGTGGAVKTTTDIMYNGDVSKWKKFANSLKFRALIRISKKEDVSSRLQELIDAGNMFTSSNDDASFKYQIEDPNANPIYESVDFGNRQEWKVNEVFVNYLLNNNDPRISSMVAKNEDDEYRGKPAGIADVPSPSYNVNNVSAIGAYYLRGDAPGNFMTHSELEFLIAEAITRSDISLSAGTALDHYNSGIASSFANANAPISELEAFQLPLSLTGVESSDLQLIAEQNWVGLYLQGFESFIEQRRTGFPVLPMPLDAYINDFPVRLNYPNLESSINATNYQEAINNQGPDLLTTKMWRLK